MEELTLQEEIRILEGIKKHFIGSGSSRTVFRHPFNRKLAVKVAIKNGGKRQNRTEIEINQLIPEYTNTIHAYGKNIIVCDLIIKDWSSRVESFIYNYSNDKRRFRGLTEEERRIITNIVESLENINGETGDNHQIGKNVFGKIVAYDYGFSPNKNFNEQVDGLGFTSHNNAIETALEQLRKG